jgi:hypothetical protein
VAITPGVLALMELSPSSIQFDLASPSLYVLPEARSLLFVSRLHRASFRL